MKEHTAKLPAASVKVYETKVTPRSKLSPGLKLFSVLTTAKLSVAKGTNQDTTVPSPPGGKVIAMSSGQASTSGSMLSSSVC